MSRFLLPPRGTRSAPVAPPVVVAAPAVATPVAAAGPRLPPRFRRPTASPAAAPVVKPAVVQTPPAETVRVMTRHVAVEPPRVTPTAEQIREKFIRIAEFLLVVEAATDPATRDSVQITAADARYYGVWPTGRWRWPELEATPADWRALVDNPDRGGRFFCGRPCKLAELPEDVVAEARLRAASPRSRDAAPAPVAAAPASVQTTMQATVQLAPSDEVDPDYVAAITAPEPVDPYADDHVQIREPDEIPAPDMSPAAVKQRLVANFKRPKTGAQG